MNTQPIYAQAKTLLQEVLEEEYLPKTIQQTINQAITCLDNEKQREMDLVRDEVTGILELLINDPNLPVFIRTQIWQIISILESNQTNV